MKKSIAAFAAVMLALGLTACGGGTAKVSIDYGASAIYSKADMDAAIALIKEAFSAWDGCELHRIRYSSDACNSAENIEWMNDLCKNAGFTQCIEFDSDFHSPKAGGGAWNADYEYTNWKWWLARTDGGPWNLMTWGY